MLHSVLLNFGLWCDVGQFPAIIPVAGCRHGISERALNAESAQQGKPNRQTIRPQVQSPAIYHAQGGQAAGRFAEARNALVMSGPSPSTTISEGTTSDMPAYTHHPSPFAGNAEKISVSSDADLRMPISLATVKATTPERETSAWLVMGDLHRDRVHSRQA